MKVVAIVQSRLNSSRFPLKCLATLGGKPLLSHVLERASRITGVDQVVLAIPQRDYPVIGHLWKDVVCGSEEDVLGRYAKAAERYKAEVIVRITADCCVLPTDWASAVVQPFIQVVKPHAARYLGACQPMMNVCDGFDLEVFTSEALYQAQAHAEAKEREHVTTWMRSHIPRTKVYDIERDWKDMNGPFKLSVDTERDLEFVAKVYHHLYVRQQEHAGAYAILEAAREVASVPQ